MSRRKFLCLDCGSDTGRIYEHYFIDTTLWLLVVRSKEGMLCIGCLEKRLGRELRPEDFPKVTINDPKYSSQSDRLRARVVGGLPASED